MHKNRKMKFLQKKEKRIGRCDFNIWHSRLRHVNKRIISNMNGLGLILKISLNNFEKCQFCSQAKITKERIVVFDFKITKEL